MLAFSPNTRMYVATKPVDFRCGIDALSAICRQRFSMDPMDGSIFIFVNRKKTSLKLLSYDGQGFWLATKRLSSGSFRCFPKLPPDALGRLVSEQVHVLCRGGDPLEVRSIVDWRKIA